MDFDDNLTDAQIKAKQLSTLLTCCYGGGAKWFEEIGAGHRDTLLWLAADLVHDIHDLIEGGHKQAIATARASKTAGVH